MADPTDAELDRLVERNNRYIASLRGENELKCGNGMASFALEESTTAITAMRARIAELEAFQQQAIKQVCELAREAGEAKGKLEASELPGIVDGWREKCERLERRVAELEACIDLVIPDDCKSQLHEDATNLVKLQARVAELEADRAEWVEVERLRMGKPTPPTPPA